MATGTITKIIKDTDDPVRRVLVEPHKKQGQTNSPAPRERAIYDLVLIKVITVQDNPSEDSMNKEARVRMCITHPEECMLFWNDPSECPRIHPKVKDDFPRSPYQKIEPLTKEKLSSLQTASALLQKMNPYAKMSEHPN